MKWIRGDRLLRPKTVGLSKWAVTKKKRWAWVEEDLADFGRYREPGAIRQAWQGWTQTKMILMHIYDLQNSSGSSLASIMW